VSEVGIGPAPSGRLRDDQPPQQPPCQGAGREIAVVFSRTEPPPRPDDAGVRGQVSGNHDRVPEKRGRSPRPSPRKVGRRNRSRPPSPGPSPCCAAEGKQLAELESAASSSALAGGAQHLLGISSANNTRLPLRRRSQRTSPHEVGRGRRGSAGRGAPRRRSAPPHLFLSATRASTNCRGYANAASLSARGAWRSRRRTGGPRGWAGSLRA